MWPYTDQETEFLAPPSRPRGELAARTLAMPADTNPAGDIFGGWIMSLMDAAGAITATHRTEGRVVTAAVSNICFLRPVKVGDVVCCYTDPLRVGRTSMTLCVEVWVLRQGRGSRVKVTAAEFTFVALDEAGRPRPIGSEAH
jgi:acyl-CoA thioesterase YciA